MRNRDDLRERTNPVFGTARATARFLAHAGDERAQALLDRLDFPEEGDGVDTGAQWNALGIECRYESANGFIDASDLPNVVDLPCGFTPRALRPELRDKRYLGLDLPAVAEAMAVAVDRTLRDEGIEADVAYRGVDATNYASVRAALEDVDGGLCITTEGLVPYLTQTELDEMCDVVHRVLEEFGGVWMTPDPDVAVVTLDVLRAFYGKEALRRMVQSGNSFSQRADSLVSAEQPVALGANEGTVGSGTVRSRDTQSVVDYYESRGFVVDREPMSAHLVDPPTMASLPDELARKVRAVYDDASMWLLTIPENREKRPEAAELDRGDFIVGAEWAGTTLRLHLVGRLDSISAPELLDFYEHQTKLIQPKDVVIDASRLRYISSAGIRTLLIFAKRAGQGHVVILHADDFMRKVLDETGAADFLDLA